MGNALQGVPEEDEEEDEEKPKDSNIESTENIDGEGVLVYCSLNSLMTEGDMLDFSRRFTT